MLRVAAINDLSGLGKCALSVSLPVLSAAGISASLLPTVVLSTHTGGLGEPVRVSLTDRIDGFTQHWKSIGAAFDALSIGYLASPEQGASVERFIKTFQTEDNIILIDPVMGDSGKLYSSMNDGMIKVFRKLCEYADIVVPNVTEACLLVGESYRDAPHEEDFLLTLGRRLYDLGAKKVVITGVSTCPEKLGAAVYDSDSDSLTLCLGSLIGGRFHGTGDIFAAVLLAAYLRGQALCESAQTAVDFVRRCIQRTVLEGCDPRFGVSFEHELPALMKALGILTEG